MSEYRHETITIGTSSVLVSEGGKEREIYIKNLSKYRTITICFDRVAESGKGIILEGGRYWKGKTDATITAISDTADTSILVVER